MAIKQTNNSKPKNIFKRLSLSPVLWKFDNQRFKEEVSPDRYKTINKQKKLKRLGFIKSPFENGMITPQVSRFSKEYYDNFTMEKVSHPNSFPFFVTLSEEDLEVISSRTQVTKPKKEFENIDDIIKDLHGRTLKERRKFIAYYEETDYFVIYDRLSNLDIHILLVIALFRHIQFAQIVKEVGETGQRVKKSLNRLHRYYLIDEYEFYRDPNIEGERVAGEIAYSYSILQHGTTMLLVTNNLSPEQAPKWKEITKQTDSYTESVTLN